MSDTQEKLPVDEDGSAWGLTINGYGVFGENDIAQIQALIDSAKREGAIEELQMIPKEGYYGDEGTAVEYVKNRIAQLKQSEESI